MMKPLSVMLLIALGLCLQWQSPSAEVVATGPDSWLNTQTGQVSRSIGTIKPNYQKPDGTWDRKTPKWVQSDDTTWISHRGRHLLTAYADGRCYYTVIKGSKRHVVGTKTTLLVKVKTSDTTYSTLENAAIDSVRVYGSDLIYFGIFYGVDKVLRNDFDDYSETFVFSQEARDSLAKLTPWSGRMLGTATKLDVDSLNCKWKNLSGFVNPENGNGVLTDEWFDVVFGEDSTRAFCLPTVFVECADSTTHIPVRKWAFKKSGQWWMAEMFNPVPTASLPAGFISHPLWFGDTTTAGSVWNIEDVISCFRASPASSGNLDTIWCYIDQGGSKATFNHRYAVYNYNSGSPALVDTTDTLRVRSIDGDGWFRKPVVGRASISSGTTYDICAWAEDDATNSIAVRIRASATGLYVDYESIEYAAWPDPMTETTLSNYAQMIYAVYTEATGVRRMKIVKGS